MKYYNNKKHNQNNGINTADISNQLSQHLANRARLQHEQDQLWNDVKRGYIRTVEIKKVDEKIGNNTYAIDNLIGKLVSIRCRSGKAYSMAVKHLKSEIARNQRIISSWEQKIRNVQCGKSHWIRPDGTTDRDCSFAFRYIANKKSKTAQTQRRLSQLIA